MTAIVARCLFWGGVAGIGYTFIGYRLLLHILKSRSVAEPSRKMETALPGVTVVLCARNEETRITARIENLLATRHPSDLLRVVVVSDGSTDGTVSAVSAVNDERVRVLALSPPEGKAACVNAGVAASTTEIIVFADARQQWDAETIPRLLQGLGDPAVGAVSGALEIRGAASTTGRGLDRYWGWEKAVRLAESRLDSCIGCTGAVYAIRRALYVPIPPNTILDDVVIPMLIAEKGYRVLFEPAARAWDPQALEPAAETRRKTRTLAGNWQMLGRYPAWLHPGGHRLWWQLLSHKYLRLATPFFLCQILVGSLALRREGWCYAAALTLQAIAYSLGTLGLAGSGKGSAVVALPAAFLFLNAAIMRSAWHWFRGDHGKLWQGSAETP